MRYLVLWITATCCIGCATYSTMQTGEVTPKGDIQLGLNLGASVPVTAIYDLMEFQQTNDPLKIAYGGMSVLLFPPGFFDLSFRYGIAKDWDLGVRLNASSLRVDGRYQIIDGEIMDLAVGLGLSFYHAPEENQAFDIGKFKRGDIDLPVILSFDLGDVFKPFLGLKWIGVGYDMDITVDPEKYEGSDDFVTLNVDGKTNLLGGLLGFYLGYKWIYAVVEVNFFYTAINAKGNAIIGPSWLGSEQSVDVGEKSFDGLVIYPALGIAFIF